MLRQFLPPKVAAAPVTSPRLQRKCACDQKADSQAESGEILQRAGLDSKVPAVAPPIVHEVLGSPGQPLDQGLRSLLELGFGTDFSAVRVHTDGRAALSARAVHALAYTVGREVVFGAGQYRPATESGRELIAHELAHVQQQGAGPLPSKLELDGAEGPLERQADVLSREALTLGAVRSGKSAGSAREQGRSGMAGKTHPEAVCGESRVSAAPKFTQPPVRRKGYVQRRRIPTGAELAAALPTNPAELAAARTGLVVVLIRAWLDMNAAERADVHARASGTGLTWVTTADLRAQLNSASRAQLQSFALAMRRAAPRLRFGDPALINIGPRVGTPDAAHINTLVSRASSIFTTIESGARDVDIGQVFGTGHIAAAKAKYHNARLAMNSLHASNMILTDRSGYQREAGEGGVSDSTQINVESPAIDHPNARESIVTMIHESMHAGNNDVDDRGYIYQPSFKVLSENDKLHNAAHYEVVPRRMLGAAHAFPGETFVPAGTTVGGVSQPALTPRQQAVREASERFRKAWDTGLDLHEMFVRVFQTPSEWNTLDLSSQFSGAPAGVHFADTLPFWSKVELLTIHTRLASINPAGVPAVRPVTIIDLALSEGLIRKISRAMDEVPPTAAAAFAFESRHTTAAERAAAAVSVNAERDLLIRLVIRERVGSLTGPLSRDEHVVSRLAAADIGDYSDMLTAHPLSAFP